jgi:hypothetical protein
VRIVQFTVIMVFVTSGTVILHKWPRAASPQHCCRLLAISRTTDVHCNVSALDCAGVSTVDASIAVSSQQAQGLGGVALKYNGMWDVLSKTVRHEGFFGLYKVQHSPHLPAAPRL